MPRRGTDNGGGTSPGTYVGDAAVAAAAEALRAEGRVAYYLGPEADGNALSSVDRVTDNGPSFQFWASYGTCSPAPGTTREVAGTPSRRTPATGSPT